MAVRFAIAATLASLSVAGGASAMPVPPLASVQAGPIASAVNAIDVTSSLSGAGPLVLYAHAELHDGHPVYIDVQTSAQLASAQDRLTASGRLLSAAIGGTRSTATAKIRALRARVRSLRRQASQVAAHVQQLAIAEARAAVDGAWLVVNGAGVVVDQSGGVEVSHVGTGAYDVDFSGSTATCLSLGARSRVQVTGPTGPVDGGFFLAATCAHGSRRTAGNSRA